MDPPRRGWARSRQLGPRGPLLFHWINTGRGSKCSLTWCCAGGFILSATPVLAPVVWLALGVFSDLSEAAWYLPWGTPSVELPSLLRPSPPEKEHVVGSTF